MASLQLNTKSVKDFTHYFPVFLGPLLEESLAVLIRVRAVRILRIGLRKVNPHQLRAVESAVAASNKTPEGLFNPRELFHVVLEHQRLASATSDFIGRYFHTKAQSSQSKEWKPARFVLGGLRSFV